MGILDYAINLSVCVTAISLIYYNLYVCIPSVCVQYSLLVFTTISMGKMRTSVLSDVVDERLKWHRQLFAEKAFNRDQLLQYNHQIEIEIIFALLKVSTGVR